MSVFSFRIHAPLALNVSASSFFAAIYIQAIVRPGLGCAFSVSSFRGFPRPVVHSFLPFPPTGTRELAYIRQAVVIIPGSFVHSPSLTPAYLTRISVSRISRSRDAPASFVSLPSWDLAHHASGPFPLEFLFFSPNGFCMSSLLLASYSLALRVSTPMPGAFDDTCSH